jgi:hypothetical protein
MSLDNIHLSPFLVQHLYKHSIVELETVEESGTVNCSLISFLGKNEKNVLIVVNEKDTPFIPDADLNLLTGILTACNLSLADVALVNAAKNKGIEFDALMKEFSPALVILFGIEPGELEFPLHFPHFQLQQYNRQTYLSAPGLTVLADDTGQKKQFWLCLQQHFFKR